MTFNYSDEDILKELEKYRTAFNESLDAIIITDGETGKIVDANNACNNILGYSLDELIGRHYLMLFDSSIPGEAPSIDNVQMFGPVVTAKNIKMKNGNIIPMDLTLSTIQLGKQNFVLSTFRDARDRIKFEAEIRRYNQELRELNASKDKFFSIIAHDLKNPLSAVMGYSELLAQGTEEISPDEIKTYSASINRVSKELSELLDNLLSWSRIQTGHMDFTPYKVNVYSITENSINLLSPSAKLKRIELVNDVDRQLVIQADENMLSTVIRNLLSNSIKFTDKGKVTVSSKISDSHAEITVEDTGIGMSEDIQKQLFHIDKTKSRPGTQNEKGTGLGLLLSKEFIKKHNGKINVASEIGKGSKFTLTLPL